MNKCLNCTAECELGSDFCCETCEDEWENEEDEYEEDDWTA